MLGCVTHDVAEGLRRVLRESPAAPAGLLALAVVVFWSDRDGGLDTIYWAPGTLLLVALLVVVLLNAPGSLPGGRAGVVALVAFAGFVGWCFLSILWADVKADAWSGSNKTLAYFAIYALFAARPWSARLAGAALGAYSVSVAAVGVWALVSVSRSESPLAGFVEGRLSGPISYPNANCALFVTAAIPAVFLASRRHVPVALRGVLLATAGVLAELALMCQSRMSLLAVPVTLLAYLLLVPGRLRSLLALAALGLAVALSAAGLLDVYTAVLSLERFDFTPAQLDYAIDHALALVAVSGCVLCFVGVAWGLVDKHVQVPARAIRTIWIAVAVVAFAVAATGSWAFADRYGSPVRQVGVWWGSFKAGETVNEADTPHLTSGFGGAGRAEIWRVALKVFTAHPIQGAGVDNFAVDYYRLRRNDKTPLYPHSVELRMLEQTGLVGTALILLFMGAAVAASWPALRDADPAVRGVAGTGLTVFAYFLAHGSVDWLWEVPALAAASFAALGLSVAVTSGVQAPDRLRRRWLMPAAVALVAAAVVTLVPPWLAAKDVDLALDSWRSTPELAFDRLERARRLNPWTDEPDVLAAVISAQRGETGRQRNFLLHAIERNPHNWYPPVELGLLEARRGNREVALNWLSRAAQLNPRDQTIRFARERVLAGDPPTQREIDYLFARSADLVTGVRQQ